MNNSIALSESRWNWNLLLTDILSSDTNVNGNEITRQSKIYNYAGCVFFFFFSLSRTNQNLYYANGIIFSRNTTEG